jgi:hypothetical protein
MIEVCPHCGNEKLLRLSGTGPHVAQLKCGEGHFIRWLSKAELEKLGGLTHEQTKLF